MSTKGQSLSYDFFIACIIFLLVIAIIFNLWKDSNIQISETQKINQIIRVSDQLSELWMRKGTPENWNSSNVISIGLISNSRLNQTKLDYLNGIGYQNVKKMSGCGLYEFYLRIYDLSNNTMFDFGSYPSDSEFVSKNQRIGILNGTIVFIDTVVWE